jgi:ketosteroid isomerase-like protein
MVTMTAPSAIARLLYAALETGKHGASLAHLFAPDAITITHPNLVTPRGGRADREAMLRASEAGASLLSRQTYEVLSVIEDGATAVVRLRWSGVVARDVGPYREGQILRAHVAQFVETRDDRIVSIETFDCYEPLDSTGPAASG